MQEVWRGRLPSLGVVNSIERKKFKATFPRRWIVPLCGY